MTVLSKGSIANVLEVRNLNVSMSNGTRIVEGVDLDLGPGEILGLVGESGSGKTTTAMALLGYAAPGLRIDVDQLSIDDKSLVPDESMRSNRGSLISYVPQDPGRALNPSLRVLKAIEDVLRSHHHGEGVDHSEARRLLRSVGLSDAADFVSRYPHQLSGGQQQRVCIATALSCSPALVVLDEPTTGLDVVSQATILGELARLRDELQVSMVYVTHDLAVVAKIADRIAVMYAGQIVEQGTTESILRHPSHPYTRGLIAATPDHLAPRALEPIRGIAPGVSQRPSGCTFAPRCPQAIDDCRSARPELVQTNPTHLARCIRWDSEEQNRPSTQRRTADARRADSERPILEVVGIHAEHRSGRRTTIAARDVSVSVQRGGCVALVGESGSGKSTIARAIAGLHPISGGSVLLDGKSLSGGARKRSVDERRRVQLIFQNPASALNPRHTVADAVGRPARMLRGLRRHELAAEVSTLLERVRLPARLADRYPNELSGGERQRVAIARALAAKPDVLLCDEITSALDVSVQAAILGLLDELRATTGLGILFITHDLGVVANIADWTIVLERGEVQEHGPTSAILHAPQATYTQGLMSAAPSISKALG